MSLLTISYANYNVRDTSELINEPSPCGKRKPVGFDPAKDKVTSQPGPLGLDLQSCYVDSVRNLKDLINALFFNPGQLVYLDLKCNKLVDVVGLEQITSLKILYIHGNEIASVRKLEPLLQLNLDALTIHGNPLVWEKAYKQWVINKFPKLKRLDFCGITPRDREEALSDQNLGIITLKVDQSRMMKQ